jgi:hypothetical protein
MRPFILGICILLIAFLCVLPLAAQDRAVPSGSDAGRGASSSASSATAPTSVSNSATPSGSGTYVDYSPGLGNRAFGPSSPSNSGITVPTLQGTSFYSNSLYSDWYNYYNYYLLRYYSLNPAYFTRFIRNREPLMTPEMLRVTLRQPLFASAEMLKMIDDLQLMCADMQAGKAVNKEAIITKSQTIRELAKQIRQDRTLSLIDLRKETDLFKDEHVALNAETITKLREITLGLVRQLNEMYALSSSSTVSVESYQEPSFVSLTKGIEKACKAIEKSSKEL